MKKNKFKKGDVVEMTKKAGLEYRRIAFEACCVGAVIENEKAALSWLSMVVFELEIPYKLTVVKRAETGYYLCKIKIGKYSESMYLDEKDMRLEETK